jgi:hypothetical protein
VLFVPMVDPAQCPIGAVRAYCGDYPVGVVMQDWQSIATAPFDRELDPGVIDNGEVYALAFPCRRTPEGWLNVATREFVFLRPTHWRAWPRLAGS